MSGSTAVASAMASPSRRCCAIMQIDCQGTRIAAREAGSGETVVLLHATASSGSQWRGLFDALRGSWHVVAPDLYGYGETDSWPGTRPFSLSQEAALVDAVLDRKSTRL